MKEIVPSNEEIDEVLNQTFNDPNKFSGMTYAEGVRAGIDWLLGDTPDNPMED